MNSKTIVVAGLALVLSAGAALAQSSAGPNSPPPRYGPPQGGPDGGQGREFGRGEFGRGERGERGGRMHRPYATREELEKRRADAFARMDANKDGRVTFEEFRAEIERRKLERERAMFRRFSGGQDSVTLDQLKARGEQRFERRGDRGDRGGRGGPDGRRGPPPAPGAAPAR